MLALVDTVPTSCVFVCDAFYDTLESTVSTARLYGTRGPGGGLRLLACARGWVIGKLLLVVPKQLTSSVKTSGGFLWKPISRLSNQSLVFSYLYSCFGTNTLK